MGAGKYGRGGAKAAKEAGAVTPGPGRSGGVVAGVAAGPGGWEVAVPGAASPTGPAEQPEFMAPPLNSVQDLKHRPRATGKTPGNKRYASLDVPQRR